MLSVVPVIDPWLAIVLVFAMLVGALVGLRLLQRRLGLGPEITRKLLHVAMGMVMLAFPWLFGAVWPVAVLAAISAILFASIRFLPALRSSLGAVIHSVARESWGEFHYAAGVLVAFAVAHDQPVAYAIAVLALAVADPAAALAGMAARRPLPWRSDGAKTVQGSAVFLAATLAMAFVVLAATGTAAGGALLVAAVLALVLMAVEAASARGLDNLLVPVTAVVLVPWLTETGAPALLAILAVPGAITLAWWGAAGRRARRREAVAAGSSPHARR